MINKNMIDKCIICGKPYITNKDAFLNNIKRDFLKTNVYIENNKVYCNKCYSQYKTLLEIADKISNKNKRILNSNTNTLSFLLRLI